MTRFLDAVIDRNFYAIVESARSNSLHRPIAIGVQALADALQMMRVPMNTSKAHELFSDAIQHIYYGFNLESARLAEKHGAYSSWEGSPDSQGKFQFDMWPKERKRLDSGVDWEGYRLYPGLDWESLRGKKKRNCQGIGLMPTASTSQILGNTEAFYGKQFTL